MTDQTGQRQDIIEALRVLADRDYQARCWGADARGWPDCSVTLTDAVHWLIDDTWLDERSAQELVPLLVRSRQEAEKLDGAARCLVSILDDIGATAPDERYLGHEQWESVVIACRAALASMTDSHNGIADT